MNAMTGLADAHRTSPVWPDPTVVGLMEADVGAIADRALADVGQADRSEPDTGPTTATLLVVPTERGAGFRASVRGHLLELADPASHGLAPTPADLLVAAIASDLTWAACQFLRDHCVTDDVNVSAVWDSDEGPPGAAGVGVTVTVAETVSDRLVAALRDDLAARPLVDALHVRLRCRR